MCHSFEKIPVEADLSDHSQNGTVRIVKGTQLSLVIYLLSAGISLANGYGESSPWQFESSAEIQAKGYLLDVRERKAGGYYNSFENTYVTNIGTQINCSVTSSATGNLATNSQAGNAPSVNNEASILASAHGNDASANQNDEGIGATTNDQTNSGAVTGQVQGVDSSTSGSNVTGSSDNALENVQDNSGNQTASTDNSVGCAMPGATLNGSVTTNGSSTLPVSGLLN